MRISVICSFRFGYRKIKTLQPFQEIPSCFSSRPPDLELCQLEIRYKSKTSSPRIKDDFLRPFHDDKFRSRKEKLICEQKMSQMKKEVWDFRDGSFSSLGNYYCLICVDKWSNQRKTSLSVVGTQQKVSYSAAPKRVSIFTKERFVRISESNEKKKNAYILKTE